MAKDSKNNLKGKEEKKKDKNHQIKKHVEEKLSKFVHLLKL